MPDREVSDERLMERVAEGDDAALEKLMRRYHGPLFSFIGRATEADPEDIYQETWIRVVRSRGRFDTRRKFSTWLFGICLNLCRDAHRRTAARPETVGLDGSRSMARNGAAAEVEKRVFLEKGLSALAPEDRELLALRYYREMTEKETAEVLGVPVGTVKSRTNRIIRRLGEILSD